MATATAPKAKTTEDDLFSSMEQETVVKLPPRGKARDPKITRIREELVSMLESRTARSFTGVEEDQKEVLSRLVRAAGKITDDEHGSAIKTSNRYDAKQKKLVWGPKEVLDELAKGTAA